MTFCMFILYLLLVLFYIDFIACAGRHKLPEVELLWPAWMVRKKCGSPYFHKIYIEQLLSSFYILNCWGKYNFSEREGALEFILILFLSVFIANNFITSSSLSNICQLNEALCIRVWSLASTRKCYFFFITVGWDLTFSQSLKVLHKWRNYYHGSAYEW